MAIARKLLAVLLCMALFGCTSEDVNETNIKEAEVSESEEVIEEVEVEVEPETLLVWSYTDEILKEIPFFEDVYNADVTVEVVEMNGLIPMASGVIKGGIDMPDILIVEESQLSNTQLSSLATDLESFALETELLSQVSPYSIEKGRDQEGKLIGLSYQVSPVGIFYRRSMAIEVFGTDEPDIISEMFQSYAGISGGLEALNNVNIKMFADIFTLREFSDMNNMWLSEDGLFNSDTISREYFELIKNAQFEQQVTFSTKWTDEWLQGMYKPITNSYGEEMKVFSYVLPSWGLSNVLMLTGEASEPISINEDSGIAVFNETSGDWAIATMANPYSLGSSYMTINDTSEHMDLSKSFIEFMMGSEHESNWLSESDMVSSIPTIQIKQSFPEGDAFLGGQSYHEVIGNIGQAITETTYEDINKETQNREIQVMYDEVVLAFIQGDFHTIDEAIKMFKVQVEDVYPELFVIVTPE